MNKRSLDKKQKWTMISILLLLMIGGVTSLIIPTIKANTWLNSTLNYIYPNSSYSDNVYINGTLNISNNATLGNGLICSSTNGFCAGVTNNITINNTFNLTNNINYYNTTNYNSDEIYINKLSNNFTYNETKLNETIDNKLSTKNYYPSNITCQKGTTKGNLSYLFNAGDNLYYNITEVTGTSPINCTLYYENITSIDRINIREFYFGSLSHDITINILYCLDGYELYTTINGQSDYVYQDINIPDSVAHVCNGNVTINILHIQNGISSHIFSIDKLILQKGFATSTSDLSQFDTRLITESKFYFKNESFNSTYIKEQFINRTDLNNSIKNTSITIADINKTGYGSWNTKIDCTNIIGGSDSDFCTDATDSGSTPNTYPVEVLDFSRIKYFYDFTDTLITTQLARQGTPTIVNSIKGAWGVYNCPTTATIESDCGFSTIPQTTLTGTAGQFFNVTENFINLTVRQRIVTSTRGHNMKIGCMRSSASQSTNMTDVVYFSLNNSRGDDWQVEATTTSATSKAVYNTTTIADLLWHEYAITGSIRDADTYNNYYVFWIDGVKKANLSVPLSTSRMLNVSWCGTWDESTDTTIDNTQIDWIYWESKR